MEEIVGDKNVLGSSCSPSDRPKTSAPTPKKSAVEHRTLRGGPCSGELEVSTPVVVVVLVVVARDANTELGGVLVCATPPSPTP